MINKDSIVTAYDEHLTLVEWLQKVEKALDNAVLTNLGIAKLSDQGNIATYQVTATFADNTTIVSDTFTLPSTNIVTAFDNLTTLVNGFEARLGRALLTPLLAPSTRKVVTIDTNGAQDNVDGTELTTLMGNIVDSHGNKRFVEGTGTLSIPEGVTITYNKWSLSGTHLMLVLAGTIEEGTTIEQSAFVTYYVPQYILNKIYPISHNIISLQTIKAIAIDDYSTQEMKSAFNKSSNNLSIVFDPITLTKRRSFRIQYDLLIDSE